MIIFGKNFAMDISDITNKLIEKKLKVTPQRMAILEAIMTLNNHPTVENIIDFIRLSYPNIATATVYKVLDTLIENEIVIKVKTDNGMMRYDAIMHRHHHLYSSETDQIEDYYDDELGQIIEDYFKKKAISGFKIEDIKLQIIGKFTP